MMDSNQRILGHTHLHPFMIALNVSCRLTEEVVFGLMLCLTFKICIWQGGYSILIPCNKH